MAYEATTPKVGRGTRIEFQDPNDSDTWKLVGFVNTAPAVGNSRATTSFNVLHLDDPLTIPGDAQATDQTIVLFDIPGNLDQIAFEALEGLTVPMRQIRPNGQTLSYNFAFASITFDAPSFSDAMTLTISGAQSGSVTKTETV